MLTLGSHFDGIAGFPLAAAGNGIEVVWATEIEPFPIVVSKAHFPNMKHYGNITDVSGAELEPVDIITFGSPCQDLSVAGKRAGLEGERSGLFMEAVRTIREMRDATSGIYPRIAVWENVPGSMSSNNGADFRAVLEEILEAEVPVPRSGKWASAGMVRGNGREIAWRILDAQYWGVPQRRRRIFLVCDFRGECAGEILFERQGVPWNPAESREAGQETTGGVGDGAKTAGRYWDGGAVSDCLDCSVLAKRQTMPEKRRMAAVLEPTFAFSAGQSDKARTLGFHEEVSPTLRAGASGTNMTPTIIEPVAFAVRTAQTGANGHAVAHSVDCRNLCENKDLSGTLQCKSNGGYSLNYQNPVRVPIRSDNNANADETNTIKILRTLWEQVGEKAFTEWGFGVFASFQQEEILQSEVHGRGVQGETEKRKPTVDDSTLPRQESCSSRAVSGVRETECERCSPQGRELEEQRPAEPPENLPELSQLKTQSEKILFDMWKTGEGPRILRETLAEIQKIRRPNDGQNQPTHIGYAVRRLTPLSCERLQGFPDNWTDVHDMQLTGRKRCLSSDTARYKALGNSVAIPCVRWIMRRIKEQIEELQDEGQA